MHFRYQFDSRIITVGLDETAKQKIPAKFEVLIVVHVKAQVFWEVTPCRLVKISFPFSVAEVTQTMVFWMLTMRGAGYVATCWGGGEGAYKILLPKPQRKRPLGRPTYRQEDNIEIFLQEIGQGAWTGLIWIMYGQVLSSFKRC